MYIVEEDIFTQLFHFDLLVQISNKLESEQTNQH